MTDDPGPYTGERWDGLSNMARLDGDHTGPVQAGAAILVRRHDGDESPLRMVLVQPGPGMLREHSRRPGEKERLGDPRRPVWFVRPEREADR